MKKRKKEEKSKKKSKKSKKSKKAKKASKKDSKKKKKRKKESSSSSDSSSDSSDSDGSDEEVWVEKTADGQFKVPDAVRSSKSKRSKDDAGDDESQVGPSLRNTSGLSHKDFGHALLPGEGAAMVSY